MRLDLYVKWGMRLGFAASVFLLYVFGYCFFVFEYIFEVKLTAILHKLSRWCGGVDRREALPFKRSGEYTPI